MKTIIEPFRIKSVEPIKMTTRTQHEAFIKAADYNVFKLDSENVIIDLLTDSGTSSMSASQWGAIMVGDESYAGSPSFKRFEAAVRHLMPFDHIIPTHQGRAAEKIVFSIIGEAGKYIPSNTHFDTTPPTSKPHRLLPLIWLSKKEKNPSLIHPFKGNMDVAKLDAFIQEKSAENIPVCMLTITNNSSGGQPVSMQSIRETKAVCKRYGIPCLSMPAGLPRMPGLSNCAKKGTKNAGGNDCAGDIFVCRWLYHERQKGRAGKHWRLAGHEQQRLGAKCRVTC